MLGDIIWTAHFMIQLELLHKAIVRFTEGPGFAHQRKGRLRCERPGLAVEQVGDANGCGAGLPHRTGSSHQPLYIFPCRASLIWLGNAQKRAEHASWDLQEPPATCRSQLMYTR